VAIGIMGATWRPVIHLVPNNRAGVRLGRAVVSAGMSVVSPPRRGTQFERIEEPTSAGPIVRGEWVRATPGATPNDAGGTSRLPGIILYIHGSGYAICSSRTHRGLTSQIAHQTGLSVFSIDYRLAPSHRFPAAPQDVRAAWDWLIARDFDPAGIVVAGDSAGGHLAVTLGLELARAGEPLPAAIVVLSPVIDLSLRHAITRDRIVRDPFAPAVRTVPILARYADADALLHDGLRIAFDDVSAFPPTLIQAGSREMLGADCTELARRIRNAGFPVEHQVWPGQMHVFQAMTALMPESHVAISEIARYVRTQLSAAQPRADLKLVTA
jgi:acetyl esterase/lipase